MSSSVASLRYLLLVALQQRQVNFSAVAVTHSRGTGDTVRVRVAKSQANINHVKRAQIHFSSHYY